MCMSSFLLLSHAVDYSSMICNLYGLETKEFIVVAGVVNQYELRKII